MIPLTGTGQDAGVFLIGAEQAHEFGWLGIIQWEEADVILGKGRGKGKGPQEK